MNREEHLTTADLARTGDDMKGRGDEVIVHHSGAAVAEAPETAREISAPPPAPGEPAPDRDARRESTPEGENHAALFQGNEVQPFRDRWNDIQGAFVDEPRRAVQNADALVGQVMKRLAEIFAAERARLEQQWAQGDNVTTEDLRVALQRYRSFFGRLLSI